MKFQKKIRGLLQSLEEERETERAVTYTNAHHLICL